MVGDGHRLVVATSRYLGGHVLRPAVFVYGCQSGHLKLLLRLGFNGGVKVEAAKGNRLTFTYRVLARAGPPADRERRDVYVWDPAKGRYSLEGGTIWPLSASPAVVQVPRGGGPTLDPGHVAEASCDDLSHLPAVDLMTFASSALEYGDFAHGQGCDANDYGHGPVCDWKTRIDEDRMLGEKRRMLVATSIHMTGSGTWDAVMVFGCRDGHVATVFADQSSQGLAVESANASALALAYGEWRRGEFPVSCIKHLVYKWDPARDGYDFVRGSIVPAQSGWASRFSASRARVPTRVGVVHHPPG